MTSALDGNAHGTEAAATERGPPVVRLRSHREGESSEGYSIQ